MGYTDSTYPGLTPAEMMKERKALIVDSVKLGHKPKRIPIMSNIWTWMIYDSPYGFTEALYDYDKMYDLVCKNHEKYEFDHYTYNGARNRMYFTDAFGKGTCYAINDEDYSINYFDASSVADDDDYPTLLEKGYIKYYFENALPRKYGLKSKEEVMGCLEQAIPAYIEQGEYSRRVSKQFTEVYGIPRQSAVHTEIPCDTLYKAIRGVRGFSADLRRREYFVEKSLDMIDEYYYPKLIRDRKSVV